MSYNYYYYYIACIVFIVYLTDDMYACMYALQDVRSIVVSVDEDTNYAVFVCAMSRYGTGRFASLRFSAPQLDRRIVTPPSMCSLFSCILY